MGAEKSFNNQNTRGNLTPHSQDKPPAGCLSPQVPGGSGEDEEQAAWADLRFLEESFTMSRGRERER